MSINVFGQSVPGRNPQNSLAIHLWPLTEALRGDKYDLLALCVGRKSGHHNKDC